MTTQKRWRCAGCGREFIFNRLAEGQCPGCASTDVEQVTFQGLFDIDTPRHVVAQAAVAEPDRMIASRKGAESRIDPPPTVLLAAGVPK